MQNLPDETPEDPLEEEDAPATAFVAGGRLQCAVGQEATALRFNLHRGLLTTAGRLPPDRRQFPTPSREVRGVHRAVYIPPY